MKAIYLVKDEFLPEAVEQVNLLHQWANEVVPKLRELLKDAKITKDGCLFKADVKAIKPILDSAPFRAFVRCSSGGGSIWLEADIHFPVQKHEAGHTVKYYGVQRFLAPYTTGQVAENVDYPTYEAKSVLALVSEYEEARESAQRAIDKAECLAALLKPFNENA